MVGFSGLRQPAAAPRCANNGASEDPPPPSPPKLVLGSRAAHCEKISNKNIFQSKIFAIFFIQQRVFSNQKLSTKTHPPLANNMGNTKFVSPGVGTGRHGKRSGTMRQVVLSFSVERRNTMRTVHAIIDHQLCTQHQRGNPTAPLAPQQCKRARDPKFACPSHAVIAAGEAPVPETASGADPLYPRSIGHCSTGCVYSPACSAQTRWLR